MKANKSLRLSEDNRGFIEAIPAVVFAVIIAYVYLNVGTFMTGVIGSELVETYDQDNTASGRINDYYNHTDFAEDAPVYYRNITLPQYCTAGDLNSANTCFNITTNTSANVAYNLTVNNITEYTEQLVPGNSWHTSTLAMFITNESASAGNTTLDFYWQVNGTARSSVQIRINGRYFVDGDFRTVLENATVGTLGNLSGNYEDNVDIIGIAITISVLLIPIMAIMSIRKFV